MTASYDYLPPAAAFLLGSTTVQDGEPLPLAQMSGILGVPGGQDRSPQLSWNGFPPGTESFVVSVYDPQAYTGSGFWHWVLAALPVTTTDLAEGRGRDRVAPAAEGRIPARLRRRHAPVPWSSAAAQQRGA